MLVLGSIAFIALVYLAVNASMQGAQLDTGVRDLLLFLIFTMLGIDVLDQIGGRTPNGGGDDDDSD